MIQPGPRKKFDNHNFPCHKLQPRGNKRVKRTTGSTETWKKRPRITRTAAKQPGRIDMRQIITAAVLTVAMVTGVQAKPPSGGQSSQGTTKKVDSNKHLDLKPM